MDKESPGAQRPQTAPSPHGRKGARLETKSKNALDQVEEANAIDEKADNMENKESKENVPGTLTTLRNSQHLM